MAFSHEGPPTIINTLYLARGEQSGKVRVHFFIDSFLMAEESEREWVTWQHLQLSACFGGYTWTWALNIQAWITSGNVGLVQRKRCDLKHHSVYRQIACVRGSNLSGLPGILWAFAGLFSWRVRSDLGAMVQLPLHLLREQKRMRIFFHITSILTKKHISVCENKLKIDFTNI